MISTKWLLQLAWFVIATLPSIANADAPQWVGRGEIRLHVEVAPMQTIRRPNDEMPAELEIDFASELQKLGVDAVPDLRTLQVMRLNSSGESPQKYGNYLYAKSEFDRPFRWYDAAIPYEFPEFADDVSRTNGEIRREGRSRGGYFLNVLGDWKRGRLAWTHTQSGNERAQYAIYFNLLPKGQSPTEPCPAGWLGDGMPRCDENGQNSTGADHCRVDVDDWNEDGLIDLVVGESYGHVLWWPNMGSKEKPHFPSCKYLFDAQGLPIDSGMGAAPKVVDWDGDGKKDLLVGAEWNRILYFQNVGTNRERKLEYRGLLEIDGKPLALPITPLARGSAEIFKRDYYPVLETVDWDADGDLDLLAGGYITGRIYFYENAGRLKDGTPQLALRGPIQVDGKPLNVEHWCASPCIVDLDADGDLDVLSGNMPFGEHGGDGDDPQNRLLRYYENIGTRETPKLTARSFPATGEFPRSHLATPRVADWDADGDFDLVVSARENLFLFENAGSKSKPEFRAHANPLPNRWGDAPLPVDQFRDWNGDGKLDLVHSYSVRLNSGAGNPGRWDEVISVLPKPVHIEHPSGIGDDWFWPYLDDFDQDGRIDVLFGDWGGHVWFHRNLSTDRASEFDQKGYMLQLKSGKEIKVGPIGKNIKTDFDALQGARTVFTVADFDRDGLPDLVVGDTYGKLRYFRNAGSREVPVFDEPIDVGDLGIRLLVDTTDWDDDGWHDLIAGAANGRVQVFLNAGRNAKARFKPGFTPPLPPIAQPRILMADLNGDGDDDLFLLSTQGSCLVERSFLEHGYARGTLKSIETKK